MATSPAALRRRLPALMLRDARRLERKIDRARRRRDASDREAALAAVAGEVSAAEARAERRRASVPTVTYPPELPVSQARDELLAALGASQVVVVAGETGSGKTTQLPKMCLELGRGVLGQVGHTQPRRLAARTVAARIAEELDVELGAQVGYQVRFTDRSGDDTLVKVMTDGILLAETHGDPALRAYDTIIVDEAHERSLNIDFLLGYLTRLLPRRPDLKVIITSATIDAERFSRHFGDARVVEVSGRTYPVEVRYRPLETEDPDDDDRDQIAGICDAVDELCAEGPGDILVFLPGERDIRETADALGERDLGATEILPLYARQTPAEQQRVFAAHRGRRIVLATNVAETSLTVPGIRYVVDPGTARISRYNPRTKVQRLPIEKISQASADQRAGRCGRVADGIAIRLYSEDDYRARPEFTDPEILRTNLASVVLQMAALDLGDVDDFPFVDPPDRRAVRAADQLLHELGAVAADDGVDRRLTRVGTVLSRLPVDPRLGRMLIEADREGAVREVLVIVAALSIQDPRQRPEDQRAHADALHARFADERSDFLAFVNLWEYLREQRRALSGNAFRRRCRAEYLHHLRVREWFDLHAQLREIADEAGLTANDTPAEAEQVHRALLAGLLSHVGARRDADPSRRGPATYHGARGTSFAVWPGSSLAGRAPDYVMAAELVETTRLWARTVAAIDPAWAEDLGSHLVTRTHHEPRWDREHGAAVASETVLLYGVPIVAGRTVPYHRVDPEGARELFIRHALVDGDWNAPHAFLTENRQRRAQAAELEARARRHGLVADDDALAAFFDARLPAEAVSAAHFEAWWTDARQEDPDRLTLTWDALLTAEAAGIRPEDYPDTWPVVAGAAQGAELALSYRFAPGEADDGVTVEVPLALLSQLEPDEFAWQVPGLRGELVGELIRGLPKQLRRELVPIADVVAAVRARLAPASEPLPRALSREIEAVARVAVPPHAWDVAALPEHLRMGFRVVDGARVVGESKDLAALQRELADATRGVIVRAAGGVERTGVTTWEFGELPRSIRVTRDGAELCGYPALVDEGETAGVRVLLTEDEQRRHMWAGTRRLLRLSVPVPARAIDRSLDRGTKLALTRGPHGDITRLLDDAAGAAIDALIDDHGGPAWDAEGFDKLRAAVADGLVDTVLDVLAEVAGIVTAAGEVTAALDDLDRADLRPAREDMRAQLDRLVYDGFVTATGRRRLPDVQRYVRAIAARIDKARSDPARDQARQARVAEVQGAYAALLRRLGPHAGAQAAEIRWMIEELRVSLFAQQLGTRQRVSEQRILQAIADAEA